MNYQPALATSALRGLHDELVAYLTLFCDERDLLQLAQTNSALYVFCREEPLWMMHCLRLHCGDFFYSDNWRLTTFFPRERPAAMPLYAPLAIRGFASDFLYRRWCRCHMELKDFVLPDAALDPFAKRVPKFELKDVTYQQYFEEYSRVPFILKNAVGKWRASTEWTPEKLVAQYPDSAKHRLTHNLDFFGSGKTLQMTFRDYFQYVSQQKDETPLYIFDPDFGEKLPALLDDYRVSDLEFFREDMLQAIADKKEKKDRKKQQQLSKQEEANGTSGSTDSDTASATTPTPNSPVAEALRPDFRWIVIGPQRTGAPWHTDPARTSAWNTLVQGRKRWAIYPPDSPPPGVATGKSGGSNRAHALNMTSLAWYLHVYPTLAPHEKPLEVIQEPGETIYVPSGWWHLILNLDTTVAVTQNFVDSHNLLAFTRDLLDDEQDDALRQFQRAIQPTRPETFDIFRLLHIPRVHGYRSQDLYVSTFAVREPWRAPLKRILLRHRAALARFDVLRIGDGSAADEGAARKQKVRVARITSLTSRVNPTFGVGPRVLVKLFSQFNQRWGEFDFASYLAPDFARLQQLLLESGAESPTKRAKSCVLQPHELRAAMNLRYAMEESFRIERDTYALIARAAAAPGASELLRTLPALVPQLYHAGHLLDVREVDDEDGDGSLWRWPYVIIEFRRDLDGLDKVVQRGGVARASWHATARWLSAEFVPRLHAVPLDPASRGLHGHSKADWDWYSYYLLCRRKKAIQFHFKEDAIPPQLMRSLTQFLPASSSERIVRDVLPAATATTSPVLLHGDITQENILGSTVAAAVKNAGARTRVGRSGRASASPVAVDAVASDAAASANSKSDRQDNADASTTAIHDDDDDDENWETCSSSDSSDDDDDGDDDADDAALEAKRRSKFFGPHNWEPCFVIDFADAKTGDPLYDLVAIFFAALNADNELWRATLDTPYWRAYIAREQKAAGPDVPIGTRLRERFLKLVLLHPSRSIKSLFYFRPDAARAATWEDVARVVFADCFALK